MFFNSNASEWAEQIYGKCNLDDPRRTKRLIDVSFRLVQDPKGSLSRICKGDNAAKEGAYKLIENEAVRPEAIAEGIFEATAKLVKRSSLCLAIQDTSDVSFSHSVADDLKEKGSPRGYLVHSTLMVDSHTKEPIGLIDQQRWIREEKGKRPGKKTRSKRAFNEKESYKWAIAYKNMLARISDSSNVITVCDREADIFELLQMYNEGNHRYVIRSSHNRKLENDTERLKDSLQKQPVFFTGDVTISQRGAQKAINGQQSRPSRKGRKANVEFRAGEVILSAPSDLQASPIKANAVLIEEVNVPDDTRPISWLLLTTESVKTKEDVEQVVGFYTLRWLIEDFHKSWKTGCNLENRKLQSFENLERMMVICVPIAVRLLQLRCIGTSEKEEYPTCESYLQTEEWQCLHVLTEPQKPVPLEPPDAKWAYYALAKLAGWTDSKRTGVVGWQTLWLGWQRLQFQFDGWRAAMKMYKINRVAE